VELQEDTTCETLAAWPSRNIVETSKATKVVQQHAHAEQDACAQARQTPETPPRLTGERRSRLRDFSRYYGQAESAERGDA